MSSPQISESDINGVMEVISCTRDQAFSLLATHKSVTGAINAFLTGGGAQAPSATGETMSKTEQAQIDEAMAKSLQTQSGKIDSAITLKIIF